MQHEFFRLRHSRLSVMAALSVSVALPLMFHAAERNRRPRYLVTSLSRKQDALEGSNSSKQNPISKTSDVRLFSNLNQRTLQHEPGDLTGAALLIAGTTIGAGILAIPAVTQDAGFVATSITCVLCWGYMVATGLLIAEVNVSTMSEVGSGGVSLVSMAMRTLGVNGVRVASAGYLFIHYTLLVAYVARSSDILSNAIGTPLWASAILFSGTFGGLCYFGSQRIIGIVNGSLVAGIIATFGVLVATTAGEIEIDSLLRTNLAAVPQSVPVIALSFVYQNVVPVVCTDLEGNILKIRLAIVLGTAIPLVMFLVWDAVILGSISSLVTGQEASDPLIALRSSNGIVSSLVETFSLLAIATSYIGFVLGLADFLVDLLKLPDDSRQAFPYLLAVVPPTGLALLSPDIFFEALDLAGAYGVLALFGILPAAMAWSQRYNKRFSSDNSSPPPPLLPGGKISLTFIMAGAAFIISTELLKNFH